MKDSLYHSLLRMASLTVALVLVFESGLLSPVTKELSINTHQYLANAIGIQASVQPTELNQITAALTAKEQELTAREAVIAEREIAVNLNQGGQTSADVATYILSLILFILLVLIGLNYLLDYTRAQRQATATV